MKVKLLSDFERAGKIKVVARRGREPIAFYEGKEIEVSDATGKKWVKAGIAEAVQVPAAKTA